MTALHDVAPLAGAFEYYDTYQQLAASQVQYSGSSLDQLGNEVRTIYGYPEEVYHFIGIKEELGETMGSDERNQEYDRQKYDRLAALMVAGTLVEGNWPADTSVRPCAITPEALELHAKEFGDLLWHTANFLNLYGVKASTAIEAGAVRNVYMGVADQDESLSVRVQIAAKVPFFDYWPSAMSFSKAVENMLREDTPINRAELALSAGGLWRATESLVAAKFGVSLPVLLDANLAKVASRIQRGTVLKTAAMPGGDVR